MATVKPNGANRTRAEALERYERYTEVPLLVLALAVVPLLLVPFVFDLGDSVDRALLATDWILWGIFAADLGVRVYLVDNRRSYLVSHWYDVIIVAVPFLRPLRILRSARALRLLRLARLAALATRVMHVGRDIARKRGLGYVIVLAVFVVFVSSSLVFALERDDGGRIDDYGTALWWGVSTITTVGYGDVVPVTPEGRGVAVLLMVVGISLFGFLTASIAAFMVEQGSKTTLDDVMAKLDAMQVQLDELKQK